MRPTLPKLASVLVCQLFFGDTWDIFHQLSIEKKYICCGIDKKRFAEALLLSTHNTLYCEEIRKKEKEKNHRIITKYPFLTKSSAVTQTKYE